MYKFDFWKLSTFILLSILIIFIGIYWYNSTDDKDEWKQAIEKFKNTENNTLRNPSLASDNNNYFFKNPTNIVFSKDLYDFDTIVAGTVLKREIDYTNIGKNPFFLVDIKVSCGCTIPHYETEPIAPQKNGKVTIEYNSKDKVGFSMNKLTLYGNVPGDQISIFFKVYVKPAP